MEPTFENLDIVHNNADFWLPFKNQKICWHFAHIFTWPQLTGTGTWLPLLGGWVLSSPRSPPFSVVSPKQGSRVNYRWPLGWCCWLSSCPTVGFKGKRSRSYIQVFIKSMKMKCKSSWSLVLRKIRKSMFLNVGPVKIWGWTVLFVEMGPCIIGWHLICPHMDHTPFGNK